MKILLNWKRRAVVSILSIACALILSLFALPAGWLSPQEVKSAQPEPTAIQTTSKDREVSQLSYASTGNGIKTAIPSRRSLARARLFEGESPTFQCTGGEGGERWCAKQILLCPDADEILDDGSCCAWCRWGDVWDERDCCDWLISEKPQKK